MTTGVREVNSQIEAGAEEQFEAARSLRGAGWSFFRIARALGISLGQVRVACDPKAREAQQRWRRERALGETHTCSGCHRELPAFDFPHNGPHPGGRGGGGKGGWVDADGVRRRSECRTCKRERDRNRARVMGRTSAQRNVFEGYLAEYEQTRPARVPVGPFAEWLMRKFAQFNAMEDGGQEAFALRLGIAPRQLITYMRQERAVVSWHVVDKVLVTEGSTDLWELYPELYPREEAA